ncbi:MAG: type II secretion system protein [Deltaproteobacteria bacterium]|nr:type II secretion system protein [Deltaproteobacteria bacterium]
MAKINKKGFTPHPIKPPSLGRGWKGALRVFLLKKPCVLTRGAGFTLIEILIVVSIIGLMLSVSLPISYDMYRSYKASLKAEEVMVFISSLKRESFLYSEAKVLTSKDGVMRVNGKEHRFDDTFIHLDHSIEFYKNGTTSGGTVKIKVRDQIYSLNVKAPLGEIFLERTGA